MSARVKQTVCASAFLFVLYYAFDLSRTTWMQWWGCAMTGWRVCSTSASSPPWQPVPSLSCCVPFPGHGDKLPAGQFVLCLHACMPSFPRPAAISMQPHVLYEPTGACVCEYFFNCASSQMFCHKYKFTCVGTRCFLLVNSPFILNITNYPFKGPLH